MKEDGKNKIQEAENKINFKDFMVFKGELVLESVIIPQSRHAIYHPNIVLHPSGQTDREVVVVVTAAIWHRTTGPLHFFLIGQCVRLLW